MPICKQCGKDTEDMKTTTCFNGYIEYQDPTALSRVPYSEDKKERCSVCNVIPGATHHKDCYMEKCTVCGMRLVSCGCFARQLWAAKKKIDDVFVLARNIYIGI